MVSFVLATEARDIADGVSEGASTADRLRAFLGLTIAVVGATESLFRSVGRPFPDQWESLERSAKTFMDHFVIKVLADRDPDLKRAVTKHRHRKLAARAGALSLVEPDRNKRTRWAAVKLPLDAPIPISEDVSNGLADISFAAEERLYDHLSAINTTDPLVLAGQAVGLLCAAECLLSLLPSNALAAFCVQLAAMTAERSA